LAACACLAGTSGKLCCDQQHRDQLKDTSFCHDGAPHFKRLFDRLEPCIPIERQILLKFYSAYILIVPLCRFAVNSVLKIKH
jgi:hypothetical protein